MADVRMAVRIRVEVRLTNEANEDGVIRLETIFPVFQDVGRSYDKAECSLESVLNAGNS